MVQEKCKTCGGAGKIESKDGFVMCPTCRLLRYTWDKLPEKRVWRGERYRWDDAT